MKTIRALLAASLALLAPALFAQDVLIRPTAITSSTSVSDLYPAVNLINGSGLSGTPTLANLGTHWPNDLSTLWATEDIPSLPDYFFDGDPVVLTCTLPRSFLVSGLVYWGFGGYYSEAKSFTVEFSTDGVNFSGAASVTQLSVVGVGGVHLPFPAGARTATHVRVTITDNHYGTGGVTNQGGDRVGLGEIRFAGSLPTQDIVNNLSTASVGSDIFSDTSKVSAHAFVAGPEALRLESITVRVDNNNIGGATAGRVARVKLWSDSGGTLPSTVIEDLGTFSFSNAGPANLTIVSTAKPLLVPGVQYWVSLQMVSGALVNWSVTSDAGSGTLPTSRAVSTDGGTSWTPNVNGNRHHVAVSGRSPFEVTNTNDSGPGSLRQALLDAGTAAGLHTITFDSSLSGQSITLQNGAPSSGSGASAIFITSTDAVTIDASSLPGGLTLTRPAGAGGDGYRCLRVGAASNVTLRGLRLTGFVGQATHSGGAVLSEHTLTMENCTVSGNTADGVAGAIRSTGTFTLTRCTLSGNTAGGFGGGAIYHTGGTSTLTQCTLSGNSTSTGNGGAIVNDPSAAATLTLTHCTVAGNSAGANGGGIYNTGANATLTLSRSILAGNTIGGSSSDIRNVNNGTVTSGGSNLIGNNSTVSAVFPAGTPNGNGDFAGTFDTPLAAQLTSLGSYGGPTQTMLPLPGSPAIDAATGSTITADQRGFPIADGDGNGSVLPDIGAAERAGAFLVSSVSDSGADSLRHALADAATQPGVDTITFSPDLNGGNIAFSGMADATFGASALTVNDTGTVTIDATALPGGLTLSANGTGFRAFLVSAGRSLTLRGLTLTGFTAQSGTSGGAIYNNGTLTLDRCTLSANNAPGNGGAIYSNIGKTLTLTDCTLHANTTTSGGGAIWHSGTLTVNRSTLSSNIANGSGGAIQTGSSSTTTLTHCTVAGNTCAGNGNTGGAIRNNGALTLTHCTFSGNSMPGPFFGAIYNEPDRTITMAHCILHGNTSGDFRNLGTLTVTGTSIIGILTNSGAGTSSGTILTSNPHLAPLSNYGGPTQTMALLPTSPARNAAAVLSPAITSDQRGFPIVGTPDIGAYEAGTLNPNFNAYIWESLPTAGNGLITDPLHASTFDFDGDGQTNGDEWIAGTGAENAASSLRITQGVHNGTHFIVTFPTVLGRTYQLQGRHDLILYPWATLTSLAGTGSDVSLPVLVTGLPKHFYRVVVTKD